ncbi:MAG: CmcJ/NvfI family oxidoreductase [Alphaproteobacteria bacterium]
MNHMIDASLNFISPDVAEPRVWVKDYGEEPVRNFNNDAHRVTIENGRQLNPLPSLDREGFQLEHAPTILRTFSDEKTVERVYYPRIERLIKQQTGASHVVVFDRTLRTAETHHAARSPVMHVHNDYTETSAPKRVLDLLGEEEARRRLGKRFAQINVWRPIGTTVQATPLAFADARTVNPESLVPTVLDYGVREGEVYELRYHPWTRWITFPNMTPDEVVLIKGYDSADDSRSRLSPHTAFIDPATPADAPPRKSIEVRAFAFFDN